MNRDMAVDSGIALSIVRNCLIVSLQGELGDDELEQIRKSVLDKIQRCEINGIVFGMSAVKMIDSYAFRHLADTARIISLLGKKPFFAAFQPGVVAALIDLEVGVSDISAFRTLEEGIEYVEMLSSDRDRLFTS